MFGGHLAEFLEALLNGAGRAAEVGCDEVEVDFDVMRGEDGEEEVSVGGACEGELVRCEGGEVGERGEVE